MLFQPGRKDNLVTVVLKTIKHFKLSITASSVYEQIRTHPDYPALKCVTDTLDHFSIKNYPLRISHEELLQVDAPFIAHTHEKSGEMLFITSITNKGILTSGGSEKNRLLSQKEFLSVFSGVVILLETTADSGEIQFRVKRQNQLLNKLLTPAMLIMAFLSILTLFSSSDFDILSQHSLWLVTKLSGLVTSGLLVFSELRSQSAFARKICELGKKASCSTVSNHASATVYGWVKWSDLGLIYFLAGVFMVLGGSAYVGVIQLISIAVIPYLFYSLYLQAFVIKKWCFLCLTVLLVIGLEFGLGLSDNIAFPPMFPIWAMVIFIYAFTVTALLLAKFTITQNQSYQQQKVKYQKLKRNPVVFSSLLLKEKQIDFSQNANSLLFGNKQKAAPRITAFLSLDCLHCKEAFYGLKELLAESTALSIHIVPVLSSNEAQQRNFMADLSQQHLAEDEGTVITMLDAWFSNTYQAMASDERTLTEEEKRFIGENTLLAFKNQINTFPALYVQGYKLSENYLIQELSEFTEMLSQLDQKTGIEREMII